MCCVSQSCELKQLLQHSLMFMLHLLPSSTQRFVRAKKKKISNKPLQGSKLKKMSGRKFATSYENLVATLKMLVAKLIEAI